MRTAAPGTDVPFVTGLAGHGGSPALLHRGGRLTYEQLAADVERAADELGPGRRLVAVPGSSTVESLRWYLAALHAGHPVLLVPGDDVARAADLVQAWDPDVVITPDTGGWRPVERRDGSAHDLHPDLALLLSTSGSTGSPKLVRLSHENLQSNATAIAEYLGLSAQDRAITTLPLHYCYGLSVVHSHLAVGASVVLTDRSVVDPCFWETFRATGATNLAGVPHTFELLDRVGFGATPVPSLRFVTAAGGRLPERQVERYAALGERDGWELYVMYGQTEATARMAYLPPRLARSHPGAIGVPIPGGSLRLDPVADGSEGAAELVYRGPNVMLGYAVEPSDLASGRTVDELRTGDLGRRTDDGLYEVVGRRSRFLKLFGLRIDLEHLERALAGHGVLGRCTGGDDGLVVAITSGQPAATVRSVLAGQLALPASAVRICALEALPRLASGKVDDAAIRRLATDAGRLEARCDEAAVDDPVGVRSLYAEVLGHVAVDDDATFVGLGGDSLSYVEVSVRLEDLLGTLPPAWHLRPVRELEALVVPRRRLKQVETNVVLRAVAIVMVVGTHAGLFEQRGGAHVLLAIAGFNVARFQLGAREAGTTARRVLAAAARVALPSMAWIALLVAVTDGYGLANVVLLNGHLGALDFDERWRFWFIEVLVQGLLVVAALFAVPGVRRLEARRPFGFAVGIVLVALALRHGLVEILDARHRTVQPQTIVWVLALGWAAQRAATVRQRLVVSALVVAAVPGFFYGEPVREAVIVGGVLALLWLPMLAIPRPLDRVAAPVAGASLAIYLTHWHVFPLVGAWSTPLAATLASMAVGLAVWALSQRTGRWVRAHLGAAGASRPVAGPGGRLTTGAP